MDDECYECGCDGHHLEPDRVTVVKTRLGRRRELARAACIALGYVGLSRARRRAMLLESGGLNAALVAYEDALEQQLATAGPFDRLLKADYEPMRVRVHPGASPLPGEPE